MPEPVLLALETSGKSGSVAILRDEAGSLFCDMEYLSPESGSAKTLAPAIERLMAKNKLAMHSLAAIALLTGPGSFTGLRVGVATAKTMAYALKIPIVEIDTLDVIALQCPVTSASVFAVFDAYRGQVFCAEYSIQSVSTPTRFEKLSVTEILDIDVLLSRAQQRVVALPTVDFCGPGCDRIRKYLIDPENMELAVSAIPLARMRWIDGSETAPLAESVARLGYVKLLAGNTLDPFCLQPRYFRGSAAEEAAAKGKVVG